MDQMPFSPHQQRFVRIWSFEPQQNSWPDGDVSLAGSCILGCAVARFLPKVLKVKMTRENLMFIDRVE
jgi:hypothetical protein